MQIFVDADACPVKDEVVRVAERHNLPVLLVSNSWMRGPDHPLVQRFTVNNHPDAADDWIAERVTGGQGHLLPARRPLVERPMLN